MQPEIPIEDRAQAPVPAILVVEDDWLLRQAVASEMRHAGWRVLEASTGEDALSMPKTAGQIDLVVTDIRLAGDMTGWDVARAFRERFADLPIVYLSGNSADSSLMVPRSTFLGKPCPPSDLMRTCRRALGSTGCASPISPAD